MIPRRDLKKQLDFLHEAEGLKMIMRHSWLSNGRRESVAEHTWRTALMAIMFAPHLEKKVDLLKVLKMTVVHDVGEIYTGDHWAFKKQPADRRAREKKGLQRILRNLPAVQRREFLSLWMELERRKSPEAKFVTALDKLEVLIQHNEADIKTWNKKEYAFNFVHGDEQCRHDPFLKAMRELVKEECRIKIKKEGKQRKNPGKTAS